MMAKKPAARYQSAREVADALAEWLLAHGHVSGHEHRGERLLDAAEAPIGRDASFARG